MGNMSKMFMDLPDLQKYLLLSLTYLLQLIKQIKVYLVQANICQNLYFQRKSIITKPSLSIKTRQKVNCISSFKSDKRKPCKNKICTNMWEISEKVDIDMTFEEINEISKYGFNNISRKGENCITEISQFGKVWTNKDQ